MTSTQTIISSKIRPEDIDESLPSWRISEHVIIVRYDGHARHVFDTDNVAAVLDHLSATPRDQLREHIDEPDPVDEDEMGWGPVPIALTIHRGASLVGTVTEDPRGRLVLANLDSARPSVRRVA